MGSWLGLSVGCQLSKHLLGHLICRALLAVAPHPALPPRGFWPVSSVCVPCIWSACGYKVQGAGLGPNGPLGAEGRMLACTVTSCIRLRARGRMCKRIKPSGLCRKGLLVHGVLMVLFPVLRNLCGEMGC